MYANNVHNAAVEGTAVGHYAVGSKLILKNAIDRAQVVLNDATNQTVQQLVVAKNALNQALFIFENGKVQAGDATALITALANANNIYNQAVEGTAVGQYAVGSKVIFKNAIDKAQEVLDDLANQTVQQLTDAQNTLNQALVIFENGKVQAGDATALITALANANNIYNQAVEGKAVGQYIVGKKAVFKAAIDEVQLVVDNATSQTAQQLTDAQVALTLAQTAFSNSKVVELTELLNVTLVGTAIDSSNQIVLANGESLILTSNDGSNAVATVVEDPTGTVKVTGVGVGGPITIIVEVVKEGQVIKTGTFTVTNVAPSSFTSKSLTTLDFTTVQPTPAQLVSSPVTVGDFTGNQKDFIIRVKKGAREDNIPVTISWKLSTDFSKGESMGSVVESAIQQFYINKDMANGDANYTELMTRPVMAIGYSENNQFKIETFSTGSQETITLLGDDWEYFFAENHAQGTDIDKSKNRTFTVSDGTNTVTILLSAKFATIDDLVKYINNRLTNGHVEAKAAKVNTMQFNITLTSNQGTLIIDGLNKADIFE